MEHPSNPQVALALEEMAEQLEHGGSRYPARAYRSAASTIRRLPMSIGALAMAGRATDVRGIGSSIQSRIAEFCETGTIEELERLRQQAPPQMLLLKRLPGVNRRAAQAIWDEVRPRSFDDLEEAAEDGRLLAVHGVGPATVDAVRLGLATLEEEPEEMAEPLLRSHARRAARDVEVLLEAVVPGVRRTHVVGQLARGFELVDVLDVVVVADDSAAATAAVRDALDHRGWHTSSEDPDVVEECLTFALQAATGAGVRIHVTDPEHEAHSVLHATGPPEHADAVARRAGVSSIRSLAVYEQPDAAIYAAAGLEWIPPELRDHAGVLDAAARGELPTLVTVEDLRGEMHCHSHWSDGRASIEEMALAARERGYGHLAITDHSWSLRIVNGLSVEDLVDQWREIEGVRTRLGDDFTLLHGIELEILPDGSLDYPDDVLERLDWVVASIHSRQRQPAEEIDRRIERAIRNPLVDCIGHPTSRLLLRRPSTALDTDRLIELAAETGTSLEINASPDRLDLDAATAARAAEAGVLLCVNSDAHGPGTLGLVEHGIAIARRAGLRPDDVVNARDWPWIREQQPRWRAG
ncbi:MAG: polymerase [Thermoleophilia bacterium]|nr:polymerase [Thermoleophilia bacterium]